MCKITPLPTPLCPREAHGGHAVGWADPRWTAASIVLTEACGVLCDVCNSVCRVYVWGVVQCHVWCGVVQCSVVSRIVHDVCLCGGVGAMYVWCVCTKGLFEPFRDRSNHLYQTLFHLRA